MTHPRSRQVGRAPPTGTVDTGSVDS